MHHLEQVDDIQVPAQLLNTLVKVEILLRALVHLKTALLATHKAADVVTECQASIVAQLALIQYCVENIVKLLTLWLMADQFFTLRLQTRHEILLKLGFLLCCDYGHVFASAAALSCNGLRA